MKVLQFKPPHGKLVHHRLGEITNANITEAIKDELVKENKAFEDFFEMVELPAPKPPKKSEEEKVNKSKPQANGTSV